MKQGSAFHRLGGRLMLFAIIVSLASCTMKTKEAAQQQPQPFKPGLLAKIRMSLFHPKKATPRALVPLWIGTVSLVDMENGFVLVDSNAFYAVIPGKELRCLAKDRETAKIRISAERNPPFFIADILSGTPRVGDRVYSPDHL